MNGNVTAILSQSAEKRNGIMISLKRGTNQKKENLSY